MVKGVVGMVPYMAYTFFWASKEIVYLQLFYLSWAASQSVSYSVHKVSHIFLGQKIVAFLCIICL